MTKRDVLEWFGTAISIVGSFAVAFGMYRIGYSCFFAGAVSWLIVAIVGKHWALFALNCFFGVANVIGLYRAFFA